MNEKDAIRYAKRFDAKAEAHVDKAKKNISYALEALESGSDALIRDAAGYLYAAIRDIADAREQHAKKRLMEDLAMELAENID